MITFTKNLSKLFLIFFITFQAHAFEFKSENVYVQGLYDGFSLLGKGFVQQFQTRSNAVLFPLGVGATWYGFEEDVRVSEHMRSKNLPKSIDIVGELGVLFNFPLVHATTFYLGHKYKNNKLKQFGLEYFAAMYLALAETGVMSYVQVHRRPVDSDNSFFETAFRGDSSFPSGHVIPYYTLFFKTLQFYGPYAAIAPLALSYMSARHRLQTGKHYFSDVIASFFLAGMASEGVRAAAGYDNNHPVYKWMFEHEARVSILRNGRGWGPRISFTY